MHGRFITVLRLIKIGTAIIGREDNSSYDLQV